MELKQLLLAERQPFRAAPCDERAEIPRSAERLGSIRVPLTLTVRPRATLYRLPDGTRWFCLRLRDPDGIVRSRCLAPHRLRSYARASGLSRLEAELAALLARREIDDARR